MKRGSGFKGSQVQRLKPRTLNGDPGTFRTRRKQNEKRKLI
jgi:hypothetical protein